MQRDAADFALGLAGEPVSRILYPDKVGSGDHSSGRPTRESQPPKASRPRPRSQRTGPVLAPAQQGLLPYLALLHAGFAVPPLSPAGAVGSYPTFSPLPRGVAPALPGARPLPDPNHKAVHSLWHFPFPAVIAAGTSPRAPTQQAEVRRARCPSGQPKGISPQDKPWESGLSSPPRIAAEQSDRPTHPPKTLYCRGQADASPLVQVGPEHFELASRLQMRQS